MVCSAEGIFTHQAFDSLSVSFFFFHPGIISFRGWRWGFGGGSAGSGVWSDPALLCGAAWLINLSVPGGWELHTPGSAAAKGALCTWEIIWITKEQLLGSYPKSLWASPPQQWVQGIYRVLPPLPQPLLLRGLSDPEKGFVLKSKGWAVNFNSVASFLLQLACLIPV